ncbi:hypothetical protein [Streptomyces sp. NPDC059916]
MSRELQSHAFAERNAEPRARGMTPIEVRVARNTCRLIYRMLVM